MSAPVLLDLPAEIRTGRLVLRPPRPGDGAAVNAAVAASIAELRTWMPWARELPAPADSEAWCRVSAGRMLLREELHWILWQEAAVVGCTGFHHCDWASQSAEIGYWVRSDVAGRGLASESVRALVDLGFGALRLRRIEIRCDARNAASARVAERCGFRLEGTLRETAVAQDGSRRTALVYGRLVGD